MAHPSCSATRSCPEQAEQATIENRRDIDVATGRIEAPVRTDDSLRAGVVAMTHGWGHQRTPAMRVAHAHPGVNVNALLPSGPGSYEKLSNQAFMTGVPVTLTPV